MSKEESQSQWQQGDYKGFSPSTDWDNVDFSKSPAIQEMPVISAICDPQNSDVVEVKNGKIQVKGKSKNDIMTHMNYIKLNHMNKFYYFCDTLHSKFLKYL